MQPSDTEASASSLQFHGKDAEECDKFVESVIKHAFAEGKSRDDEWIADFVASRMTGDALRWLNGLDDEVQGSWKKLKRAMFTKYTRIFYGTSGEEAEEFVRSVRQAASDAGKDEDNKWIIKFVFNSLAGDALRWHLSLDRNIREDWELLQVAILVQYPREGGFQDLSLVRVPTPAPAAPVSSMLKRAHIRVCKENDSTLLYMTKQSDSNGLRLSPAATEALIVEYDASVQGVQSLTIPPGQISTCDRLVAHWNSVDTSLGSSHAYIYGMNCGSDSTPLNSSCRGEILQHPWIISFAPCRIVNFLSLTAMDNKGTVLLRSNGSLTWLWFRRVSHTSEHALELFVEPI